MAGHIAPHSMRVAHGAALDSHLRCLHQGTIAAYSLGYGAPVELRIDPSARTYLVLLAGIGTRGGGPGGTGGTLTVGTRTVPLTPAIVTPGKPAVLRIPKNATVTVICIPRRMIDTAARFNRNAEQTGPIEFEPYLDTSTERAGPWLSLARTFAGTPEPGRISDSPLAMAHFEQLLVHGLLAAQPNSTRWRSDASYEAMPASLASALAFCERYTGPPPSVADIAAAAHVSKRTLQTHFRLYLGTTPQSHLRGVRLRRVHKELVDASAEDLPTTVTEVALRHGFQHMGRFAIQYRALYGRRPSETLRFGVDE
ncbi:AraC family transcriptional regulator [Yinghuangia sp. ASG 101]|uniref:AraC family transcriptional regulator n=1 Tax=Yinghuangia sp. ASG 101 TaxID=2896848 RepID=UPI001E5991AB|nr:AraC family transcriptional regulator [Yinghuangia sp. ASG 101]UGQ12286.1 AraC family transcriptional regulator [Yinghuangia sp. ASG 101]